MNSLRQRADGRQCRGGKRWDRRGGFTLVELLIVIAIIALMVTTLLPSLDRAREMAKMAVCRSNLRQLWEVFHANASADALRFPLPRDWLGFVGRHGALSVTICPCDDPSASPELALGDVYLVQSPTDCHFYPVLDAIEGAIDDPFQLRVIDRGGGVYEFWLGDDTDSDVLAESDADGACHVVLGGTIAIVPLYAPGCEECGSEHYICHGPNMGSVENWGEDVKRRLTGRQYHQVDPPYYVTGGGSCSYGMNVNVKQIDAPASQLLLLDYEKLIADPEVDTIAGDVKYLAPRHMSKVNGVFVDGSVRSLWPWEVEPGEHLWEP